MDYRIKSEIFNIPCKALQDLFCIPHQLSLEMLSLALLYASYFLNLPYPFSIQSIPTCCALCLDATFPWHTPSYFRSYLKCSFLRVAFPLFLVYISWNFLHLHNNLSQLKFKNCWSYLFNVYISCYNTISKTELDLTVSPKPSILSYT